jgi:hypothetical protein
VTSKPDRRDVPNAAHDSQLSLAYLRAVILAQGAIQPAHRSDVTVWLLGDS